MNSAMAGFFARPSKLAGSDYLTAMKRGSPMHRSMKQPGERRAKRTGSKWTRSDQGREIENIFGESGWKRRSAKQAGRAGADVERGPEAAPARTRPGPSRPSSSFEKTTKKLGRAKSGAQRSDRRGKSATKISHRSVSKRKPIGATKAKSSGASKPRGPVAK